MKRLLGCLILALACANALAGDGWSYAQTACSGGQGSCPITEGIIEYGTVASGDDATLPSVEAGVGVTVINTGANALDVWPATSDDLGEGVDTAHSLAPDYTLTCVGLDATNWRCREMRLRASGDYAQISVIDNSTDTTISSSSVPVQVVVFDTNGPAKGATPDHTTDDITVATSGDYFVSASVTLEGVSLGSAADFEITLEKNNGATLLSPLQAKEDKPGGNGEFDSISISGLVALSSGDTVEMWIANLTNTSNIRIVDATLTIEQK